MNGADARTSAAGASGDAAKITFRSTSTRDTNPQLNEIRKSTKKFCDVKISFGGNDHIYAHKVILQTASTVFEEWLGSSESINAVKLNKELAPFGREAVDSVISFLYTGELEVDFSDLDNLELLISAAQRLQIGEINLNSCAELLLEVLSVKNCWTIQDFARRKHLDQVLSHVENWIKNYLPTILEDGNVQNLSYAQMKIAVQNAVPISSSEKLFATIVAWMSHSEDDRKQHLTSLLHLAEILSRAPHLLLQSDVFRRVALDNSKNSNPQQLPSSLSSLNMRQNQSSPASTSGNASSAAPKSNTQSDDTGRQNKRRRELQSTPAPPPPDVEELADSDNNLADEQMDVDNNANFVSLSPNPEASAGILEVEDSDNSADEPVNGNKERVSSVANPKATPKNRATGAHSESPHGLGSSSGSCSTRRGVEVAGTSDTAGLRLATGDSPRRTSKRLLSAPDPSPRYDSDDSASSVIDLDSSSSDSESEAEEIKFLYPRITEEIRGRRTITEKQVYTFDFKYYPARAREQSSIIVHRSKVFDFGGRIGTISSKLTTIYDISSETLNQGPSLSSSAYEAAVCLSNNCIYVIGGCETDGHGACAHNCTQMLDLNKNPLKFQERDCMNFCRGAFDAEVLDGKIYAVGGIGKKVFKQVNNRKACLLKTVEVYDPDTNEWKLLPPKSNLKEARAYFKLCSLENKLYAIGGSAENKANPLKSVEVFDPLDGTWKLIAPMKRARSWPGAYVHDGLIYVVGGDISGKPSIEIYDPRCNQWNDQRWPSKELYGDGELNSGILL